MFHGFNSIVLCLFLDMYKSYVSFSDTNISAAVLSEMATQQVADEVVAKQ